ncbi:nuclear transport factor 2 family protein [Alteromonas sp. S005]|uniref:nuclear transport factor 2 family protein n=1 Tax=Alteromonas sp. S005 TaxID=3117400 RepID=UPI002FE019F4
MYKLLLLFVFLSLSFTANAALSERELEQLATKFVEAKNARQQPNTTIQDIDAFINLIADEFVDEHVKFKVTITEKSALREGLIAKMSDKIYYSSIVINQIMTGGNVAIIKMTESGKVRPNHLDKDITYSSVNIVTLEFNKDKLITHIRRHHG